jgi:hypothetical protein
LRHSAPSRHITLATRHALATHRALARALATLARSRHTSARNTQRAHDTAHRARATHGALASRGALAAHRAARLQHTVRSLHNARSQHTARSHTRSRLSRSRHTAPGAHQPTTHLGPVVVRFTPPSSPSLLHSTKLRQLVLTKLRQLVHPAATSRADAGADIHPRNSRAKPVARRPWRPRHPVLMPVPSVLPRNARLLAARRGDARARCSRPLGRPPHS